jgi:hypothetical protein
MSSKLRTCPDEEIWACENGIQLKAMDTHTIACVNKEYRICQSEWQNTHYSKKKKKEAPYHHIHQANG